ncbi:YbbR-like domain-containing protein [Pueribacillus sp. YX66]|uniref:CdaR family protein n=1 Tax=Pueribacillus sp. YX66 TaxID=3229242 RepID=UPI00358D0497
MDKLLKSNWFVVLISFIFALMLYATVAVPKNMQNSGSESRNQVGQEQLEDVEVHAYYDEAKYVVSGVPETVDVTLSGSPTQLFMARMEKNLEVFADLNNLSVGTHTVRLQHRGLSDGIDVAIYPASITVTIEERVSKDFPITIEYVNKDSLPEGYNVSDAVVSPTKVTIYGSESQLNQIASIKGFVDLDGAQDTFMTSVPIKVYDKNDNELTGFSLNPNVVDVEIPIVSPHKFVPIKINRENSLPDGLSIESISANPETVVIFGSKGDIEKIEFVEVAVDLNKLSDKDGNSVTLTVDIPLPKGVKRVEPEQIEITIELGKKETKTIKNVPLEVNGLREGLTVSFIDPKDGELDVAMSGAKTILERITAKDIHAIVDASGLGKGEHSVEVKFNGPQNVSWQKRKTTISIH